VVGEIDVLLPPLLLYVMICFCGATVVGGVGATVVGGVGATVVVVVSGTVVVVVGTTIIGGVMVLLPRVR